MACNVVFKITSLLLLEKQIVFPETDFILLVLVLYFIANKVSLPLQQKISITCDRKVCMHLEPVGLCFIWPYDMVL